MNYPEQAYQAGTVLLMGTLDTKGAEINFLRELILQEGLDVLLMDTNMGGEPALLPDIPAAEVAAAGGGDIRAIRESRDTDACTSIMIKGAIAKACELYSAGKVDGLLSIGGASGTALGTAVMKSLPFGVPKLMVSSTASMPGYAAGYIGTKDIIMMHSVVDIAGINDLVSDVLARAAGAMAGMVKIRLIRTGQTLGASKEIFSSAGHKQERPLIALTEFKFSEGCCRLLRDRLTQKGFDVIAFHAQGIGDQAMEELISQGWFHGVLDIVPSGISEGLLGGNRATGPDRLRSAALRGLPQVITPCGFDMLSCGPLQRRDNRDRLWTDRKLAERPLFIPDSFRVQARTRPEELLETARETANRLNMARGPVVFLVPTKGWSSLSSAGGPLYDPEADKAFVTEFKSLITSPMVTVKELDLELNSLEFAQAVLETFEKLMEPVLQGLTTIAG